MTHRPQQNVVWQRRYVSFHGSFTLPELGKDPYIMSYPVSTDPLCDGYVSGKRVLVAADICSLYNDGIVPFVATAGFIQTCNNTLAGHEQPDDRTVPLCTNTGDTGTLKIMPGTGNGNNLSLYKDRALYSAYEEGRSSAFAKDCQVIDSNTLKLALKVLPSGNAVEGSITDWMFYVSGYGDTKATHFWRSKRVLVAVEFAIIYAIITE